MRGILLLTPSFFLFKKEYNYSRFYCYNAIGKLLKEIILK